jgi:hypothetical protein
VNGKFQTVRAYVAMRDGEHFIVVLDISRKEQVIGALGTMGRWASNPDLVFTWEDAKLGAAALRRDLEHVDHE